MQHSLPSPSGAPAGKMQIPRLSHPQSTQSASKGKGKERTSHACDKCRKAKAKCSGGNPCEKCKAENRECFYGDGKRDKDKKEMERLVRQNHEMYKKNQLFDRFVRSLNQNPSVAADVKRDIGDLFFKFENLDNDHENEEIRLEGKSADIGEQEADAEIASMGSLDAIDEDTNRDAKTRAAGYMGKSSAVRWVQSAHDKLNKGDSSKGSQKDASKPINSFESASYHAGEMDFPAIDPSSVNPLEVPNYSIAEPLVESFFEKVHPSFPILSQNDFRGSLREYYKSSPEKQQKMNHEKVGWLCNLNMVFAIAARYAQVTNADFKEEGNSYLVYHTRARALGLDEMALHQDAELEHTSCLGLLSLYYLSLDQVNRAWTISGLAIRHALTLGLHVRSKTRSLSDVDKEYRVRLFWSLYALERLLNQLTGRPSCVSPRDISADLPLNVDETTFDREKPLYQEQQHSGSADDAGKSRDTQDQNRDSKSQSRSRQHSREDEGSPMDITPQSMESGASPDSEDSSSPSVHGIPRLHVTESAFFIYTVRLAIISHDIFNDLYSPSMVNSKWSKIQKIIRRVDRNLKTWRHSLPWEFDFEADGPKAFTPSDNKSPNTYSAHQRRWDELENQRIGLSLLWNSSRMILYRPTLCRLKHQIPKESERSKDFNASAAETCIGCARNIIACLPTKTSARSRAEQAYSPDTESMYRLTPWWNTIHYIIEAASVLMLELAYRAEHVPAQAEEILEDAKRAVSWMKALSPQSVAAKKGYVVYEILLRRVAPKVGHFVGRLTRDGELPKGEDGLNQNHTTRPGLSNGVSHHDSNHSPHHRRPSYQRAASYLPTDSQPQWANPTAKSFLPQTQEPRQTMQHSDRHFYGLPPPGSGLQNINPNPNLPAHLQSSDQQMTGLTTLPETTAGYAPPTTMPHSAPPPGMDLFAGLHFGLDALQSFHYAGDVYGRYDEFGPWLDGIEAFPGFDQFSAGDPSGGDGGGGYIPQGQMHAPNAGGQMGRVDTSAGTPITNALSMPVSASGRSGTLPSSGLQDGVGLHPSIVGASNQQQGGQGFGQAYDPRMNSAGGGGFGYAAWDGQLPPVGQSMGGQGQGQQGYKDAREGKDMRSYGSR